VERNEEVQVNAAPWKVYPVTVLPDEKGKTRKLHARVVNNMDSSDIFKEPITTLMALCRMQQYGARSLTENKNEHATNLIFTITGMG
jgi:hypothetical protein